MSLQNVLEHHGIGLTITGMLIVFTALVLVSLFIAWLPRVLGAVGNWFPEVDLYSAAASPALPRSPAPSSDAVDEAIVAAIGFVLHKRRDEG